MRTVGLKVLKNKLSEYIRAVAAGETVLVTDRDRIVAEIVPPRIAADALRGNPVIAELVREGLVTPARIPASAPMPPRLPPLMTFEEMMRDLDASRSDR